MKSATELQLENDRFAKLITHDLANPLTVLLAYNDLFLKGKIAPGEELMVHQKMKANLESALELIHEVRVQRNP